MFSIKRLLLPASTAIICLTLLGAATQYSSNPYVAPHPPATKNTTVTGTFNTPTPTVVIPTTTTTTMPPIAPYRGYRSIVVAPVDQVNPLKIYSNPDGEVNNNLPSKDLVMLAAGHPEGEWIQVYTPVRPNGSKGYVKLREVDISGNNWSVDVNIGLKRIVIRYNDEIRMDVSIGVAKQETPTPRGLFYLASIVQTPDPNGPYGPKAYGLSGYSEVLQSFGGGPGQLGIHGTNDNSSIGTEASHGCVRLHNADIEKMVGLQIPLGTPVTIS